MIIPPMPKVIVLGISLLVLIAGVIMFRRETQHQQRADALFDAFKKQCRIVEQSPFNDDKLGIRFEFREDELVCDHQSPVPEVDHRDISIWKEAAFHNAAMNGFGRGLIAKIVVNPLSGLPATVTITTTAEMIDGTSVPVRTVAPASCEETACPTARVAEIRHQGNALQLEEYTADDMLFRSFRRFASE